LDVGAAHVFPRAPDAVRPYRRFSERGPPASAGQLAAVGALILAVVFLLGFLSVVVDDPVGLVLAPVFVFVIAFFGWLFVTTRGYRRKPTVTRPTAKRMVSNARSHATLSVGRRGRGPG